MENNYKIKKIPDADIDGLYTIKIYGENGEEIKLADFIKTLSIRVKIIKHSRHRTAWYDDLFGQIIDVIYVGQVHYLDLAEWHILADDYNRFIQKPGYFQKGLRFIKQDFIEECT